MSIITSNIISTNISSLESIAVEQYKQIQQLTDLYSDQYNREFDQFTKQNVFVTYSIFTKTYRFEIRDSENDVHVYQIWKKNNNQLNSDRIYFRQTLRNWISKFNTLNVEKNYNPTTIIKMDIEEKNGTIKEHIYPTVLIDARVEIVDGVEKCFFSFNNSLISPLDGIVVENFQPLGYYTNVRFDINSVFTLNNSNPI
jgi:gluconate kinase